MQQVLGCSVSYRIAVGPQQGRKVFMLQTIPSWEDDDRFSQVAKASGFSLHAVSRHKPGKGQSSNAFVDTLAGLWYQRNGCH